MKQTKSWKKWRTVSAAAAAGVSIGGASLAGIVVTNVNTTFNFGDADLVLDLPGINDMRVFSTAAGTFSRSVGLGGAAGATYFQVRRYSAGTFSGGSRKILQAGPQGATWNALGGTIGNFGLLGATDTTFGPIGPSGYTDSYFGFTFKDSTQGGALRYGWLEASLTAVGSPSTVTVDIQRYAYDTSGAPIPLGAVPEPSTLVTGGLAALITGAAGIRRWRKRKQEAAA